MCTDKNLYITYDFLLQKNIYAFLHIFQIHINKFATALQHKVRTYKEYHSVCPSSELGLSQPLSRQRVFPSPQKQGGGGTLACGWGVGGSPNSDEGHTLWYSLYVRTLCFRLNFFQVEIFLIFFVMLWLLNN